MSPACLYLDGIKPCFWAAALTCLLTSVDALRDGGIRASTILAIRQTGALTPELMEELRPYQCAFIKPDNGTTDDDTTDFLKAGSLGLTLEELAHHDNPDTRKSEAHH